MSGKDPAVKQIQDDVNLWREPEKPERANLRQNDPILRLRLPMSLPLAHLVLIHADIWQMPLVSRSFSV